MDQQYDNLALRPHIEGRWADAFTRIRNSLQRNQQFAQWLRAALNKHSVQLAWPLDNHAARVGQLQSSKETLGLLVAFYIPGKRSFRFAFPHDIAEYRQTRTLFDTRLHELSSWFPTGEVLRHMNIQMNFSYRDPLWSSNGPVKSMFLASFLAGIPLYCGDVRKLKTDEPHDYKTTNGIRFRSIDEVAEQSWGVASVLYIPIQYPQTERDPKLNGRESSASAKGLCLCFHSPRLHIFKDNTSRRQDFVQFASPEWVEEFRQQVVPIELYDAMVDIDQAARHAAQQCIENTYQRIDTFIETVRDGFKNLIEQAVHKNGRLSKKAQDRSQHGIKKTGIRRKDYPVMSARENNIEEAMEWFERSRSDLHLDLLLIVGRTLKDHSNISRAKFTHQEVSLLLDLMFYAIPDKLRRNRLTGSRLLAKTDITVVNEQPGIYFDHIPTNDLSTVRAGLRQNPFARCVANVVTAFIRNCENHGCLPGLPNGEVFYSVDLDNSVCQFAVKNACYYDEETLKRYWAVRESLLPPGPGRSPRKPYSHGMQLYLIQMLAHEGSLHVEHRLEPIASLSITKPLAQWTAGVTVPYDDFT